jgi:phosphoglycerol transferase MdoB-like AlkP superfamily enzyme
MFEYSISHLNDLSRNDEPFLAVYMTASDHAPYIIPDDISFSPRNGGIKQKIIEYADWSIGYFIESAKRQEWFENTLFVMVADHGSLVNSVYDMPLTYHHTPLIMYAPEMIGEPKFVDGFGGQIDIFPTIMGLLNISYVNNTMGIDLLKEHRPYIYFSADDKIGCLNDEFFYVIRTEGGESFYRYRNRDTKNYLELYPDTADSMKEYVYSMLQVSQWMVSNRMVGPQERK